MSKYNFFFSRTDMDEDHTEAHLMALVNDLIAYEPSTREDLFAQVTEYYKGEKINYSAFKRMLDDCYVCIDYKYTNGSSVPLHDENADDIFSYMFMSELKELADYSIEELYSQLSNLDDSMKSQYIHKGVLLVNAIEIKLNSISYESGINTCEDIEINLNTYITRLSGALNSICSDNDSIPVSSFIKSEICQKYMYAFSIQTALDLKNTSTSLLLILCSIDIKRAVMGIESLSGNYLDYLLNLIDNSLLTLNDREYFILLKRHGYFTEEGKTLEEVAADYDVTRERVRQIESKANKKLIAIAQNQKEELRSAIDFITQNTGSDYVLVSDLIKDDNSRNIYSVCLLLNNAGIEYRYDAQYNMIYNASVLTVEGIENVTIEKWGKLFSRKKLDAATPFELKIIENNYVLSGRTENLYRLKRYNQTEFLIDLIDELFPNGYRCYNDDDYFVLSEEYGKRLGDDVVPSKATVRGIVGRDPFRQIDKGTYCLKEKCIELPADLRNRICDFIIDHLPAVDYITIFEAYKPELDNLGIPNYYYLKGVLDPTLPDVFTTKRNYITEAGNAVSAIEARIRYMHSFPGPFSFDDLKQQYPGVKITVFQLLCYDEVKNGLLLLGQQRFVYADKLQIRNDQIALIKRVVDDLLSQANGKVISSRKVYAKIKLYYPELIYDLKYIDNQVAMYSLVKYLFNDDYYYDRPYISSEKPDADKITTRGLIRGYLEELPEFDYEVYRSYCLRINIPMVYTYVQIIDEFSDDFVQLEDRRLIRKDIFDLSQESINEINSILDLVFSKSDLIDTSRFNGYMMLPKIKYRWNKHVFAGIVRSYLSDRYEVVNVTDASLSEPVDYKIVRCTV